MVLQTFSCSVLISSGLVRSIFPFLDSSVTGGDGGAFQCDGVSGGGSTRDVTASLPGVEHSLFWDMC